MLLKVHNGDVEFDHNGDRKNVSSRTDHPFGCELRRNTTLFWIRPRFGPLTLIKGKANVDLVLLKA